MPVDLTKTATPDALTLREQAALALAEALIRVRPQVKPIGERTYVRFREDLGEALVTLSIQGSLGSNFKTRHPIVVYEITVRWSEPSTTWFGRLFRLKEWRKTERRLTEPLDITDACLKILIELKEATERGEADDQKALDDRIIAKLIEALKAL